MRRGRLFESAKREAGRSRQFPMADNTTVFNAADDYERFMGRWSRAIGEKFLDWLGRPRTRAGSMSAAAPAPSAS